MIPLLPRWNLHANRPTFYDTDAVTMLELASRLHGSMNELIADYNKFTEELEKKFTEFIDSENKDEETFRTALRQEFQDFIDTVDLKMRDQDRAIENAKNYLTTNLKDSIRDSIINIFETGGVELSTIYDPETKNLSIGVNKTGGETE